MFFSSNLGKVSSLTNPSSRLKMSGEFARLGNFDGGFLIKVYFLFNVEETFYAHIKRML